jgi:hypothetical protein
MVDLEPTMNGGTDHDVKSVFLEMIPSSTTIDLSTTALLIIDMQVRMAVRTRNPSRGNAR